MKGPRATSLQELAAMRQELQARQRAAEEAARAEREREAARERERNQFAQAVGPVRSLKDSGRAAPARVKPEPTPRQRELDEQAALREAWSDEVDIETLLLTDDGLSYRREGVSPDVASRLRRGQWAILAELDLHGLRREEAREALLAFVHRAKTAGLRCLRVVHGKGHGSPGREPVLKARVQRWLAQSQHVIAFAQASGPQGGAGALLVLLTG